MRINHMILRSNNHVTRIKIVVVVKKARACRNYSSYLVVHVNDSGSLNNEHNSSSSAL